MYTLTQVSNQHSVSIVCMFTITETYGKGNFKKLPFYLPNATSYFIYTNEANVLLSDKTNLNLTLT